MENKTEAVRREILKSILDRYAGKGKAVIIKKAKEQGVYKAFVDDLEVWELIQKFAAFHNIPITEPKAEVPEKEVLEEEEEEEENNQEEEEDDDSFLKLLKDEHTRLSKRLLALNRVIQVYEKS